MELFVQYSCRSAHAVDVAEKVAEIKGQMEPSCIIRHALSELELAGAGSDIARY